MKFPSSWWGAKWREALPSGNGEMGAAVYGGIDEETIMLTHTDLWWKSKTPELPDVSEHLPEVRRLLSENDPVKADRVLTEALMEKGYNPTMASPLPLADLNVHMPSRSAFKKYKRSLNMENGQITVKWVDGINEFNRSLFVSRTDNLIAYKISSSHKGSISATFQMGLHDRKDIPREVKNPEEYLPQNLQVKVENEFIFYGPENGDGKDFGAVSRVIHKGGQRENSDHSIKINDADEVLILIKIFVKGDRLIEWHKASDALLTIDESYDSLLKKHEIVHKGLLNSMTLSLHEKSYDRSNEELLMEAYSGDMPNELLEKMWTYGRYLLISSSKESGHPCHLYGLWCGEYQGMWAFNMLNENVQMIYWHALSGNMPELLLALFDYYESLIDDFRVNAKNLYGCRGIYIPAPTVPDSGLLKHVTPHIIHWTGGSGWLSQHYFDYYLYTGDLDFLKDRAFPFMIEAALFYEDFFTEGEDGFYMSSPSNSPENTPGNYWNGKGMGAHMETTMNATMDYAIAKELLGNLIKAVHITGLYTENLEKWKKMFSRIPEYQINSDGAVKEWMHPDYTDNYHHRHESHLYPVFPGTEVTRENDPKLFEAFEIALQKRLVIGLKEQSGWSLAHMANNYARMGEGNKALECLEIMSRACILNNFYTTHNDWRDMGIGVDLPWAPIQLDANMGWCSAINEMLLFSVPGKLTILPALPEKWRKGTVEGMLARGAILVSINWDLDIHTIEVQLLSKNKDCTIELILPAIVKSVSEYKVQDKKIQKISLITNKSQVISMSTF
jgi:alpha-L-fucosidase 2